MTRGRLLRFAAPFHDLTMSATMSCTGGTLGALFSLDPSLGGLAPVGTADEINGMVLDGDYEADAYGFGFISTNKTDSAGAFGTNPTITVTWSASLYQNELTIIFADNELCAFDIAYKYNNMILTTESVTPTERVTTVNSGNYNFNNVTITFTQTLIPERYVKLSRIFPGRVNMFEGSELVSVDITRECNMGGIELPAGSLTAVIASDAPAMFKYRQLVIAYWGDQFIGHFYVDKVKRQGPSMYAVTCTDAIGVLADTPYAGTYFGSDTDLLTAADSITGTTYYDCGIEQYHIENIRGAVLATSVRDALLSFGVGAALYCSQRYDKGITPTYTFKAPLTFGDIVTATQETYTVHTIPPERIYNDADTDEAVAVSQLEIISHALTSSSSGSLVIGNSRYNDAQTSNTYAVTSSTGLPNEKRIAEAYTIITGKRDSINTDPSDVYTIGHAVADYLKKLKWLIVSEAIGAEEPADLADTIEATIDGTTYKANVEKINYTFGATIMKATYTAFIISEA